MDRIDCIVFLLWSAFLYGVADINGWRLLGYQAGWLTVVFLGRRGIDWYVELKSARATRKR